MANEDLVILILQMTASYLEYMLPVIGIMAGIIFVVSFLYAVTLGASRKVFRD